jgi:predicted small lipoprotein YifL
MKMRNSLILLVVLTSLTACADRERLNCPPTKNKALRGVTETITPTTAPAYGTGGKCL